MTKIGTYTVGAGTDSSVSFTNIPQTYTDLIVKVSGHLTGTGFGAATIKLIFNSSISGYSWRSVFTDCAGGSYSQKGDSVAFIEAGILPASQLSPTLNVFGIADMLISNYSSNNSKAVSIDYAQENGYVDNYIGFVSGIWSNTAPVTSLTITPNSSNFSQYSTFTLYGVKSMRAAAGNSIKATGGSVNFDGTYVTHTFNTTGSFTPTQPILADYLVIAGGGGGGATYGAGGGAGGYLTSTGTQGGGGAAASPLYLSATSYTVTIGAGGAAGVQGTNNGSASNGSNSQFLTITSTGGGGGAGNGNSDAQNTGGSGGSSGGGTYLNGAAGTPTASPVQGYTGGAGPGGFFGGGGGGGAGSAGVLGAGADTCVGGNGLANSITGSSVTRAGGGGAYISAGGSGGGGAGGGVGSPGQTNTGSGGGASTINQLAGAGGSGIVIIRYKG
jgi:hypothetical protein